MNVFDEELLEVVEVVVIMSMVGEVIGVVMVVVVVVGGGGVKVSAADGRGFRQDVNDLDKQESGSKRG